MRLAGRVLTRGADGTDMPDGIKPPKRGPATEPLQLSTVFRGVQVLQTAITGLPIVEQRGGRDLPDVSPMVLQPDVSRSRRDFIADIVAFSRSTATPSRASCAIGKARSSPARCCRRNT